MRFVFLSLCALLAGCTQNQVAPTSAPIPATPAPTATATAIVVQSTEAPPPALPAPLGSSSAMVPSQATPRHRNRPAPRRLQSARSQRSQSQSQSQNRPVPRLSGEEVSYIASTRQMEAILFNGISPDDPDAPFSPLFYGNIIRARTFFKNIPAPPRFAQADRMMGKGLSQSLDALTERQIAIEMGLYDRATAERTLQKMRDGARQFDAGYLQITGAG